MKFILALTLILALAMADHSHYDSLYDTGDLPSVGVLGTYGSPIYT